jgi:mono/diheme cytochrome c family protein
MFRLLVAAALLVLTGAVAAQGPAAGVPSGRPASPAPQTPSVSTDEGKKLYVSYGCYQCHGIEAQGSSATGPRLGPRGMPQAAFIRYVRRPTGQMPLYTEKILPTADLEKIYAYASSRPAAKPLDNLPLLSGDTRR